MALDLRVREVEGSLGKQTSIVEEEGQEDYRLSHTIWNPNKSNTLEEKEMMMENKWRFRT